MGNAFLPTIHVGKWWANDKAVCPPYRTVALSNPTVVNCPFTNDAAAAQADPDKCYVVLVNPPPGMTVDHSGALPSMSVTIEAAGSFPITTEVHKFDGSKLVKIGEVNTPNLALLEERPVTFRVAWQDFPSLFSEQVITAVGGTESNMKLVVEAPQKIPDTQIATIKVKVGKYSKTGITYTPDTMGQWRTQIFAQTNSQSVKTPITEMKDMVNGEAEFQINPAGNLFMKLTAVSELVSNVDGLDTTLTSWARYIDVVKGSPIEGTITSKSIDGPAPKTFTLNLNMTPDNRVALKEVSWEESTDNGVTWTAIEKSNTIRHNVAMQDPGRRLVRAKMINKNTLVENYATPVEVWAYSTLEASITGPRHMAPGYAATLAAELYREGVLTSNTVNEWTIEAPSGTTTTTGATATITAEQEGKMYVTLDCMDAGGRATQEQLPREPARPTPAPTIPVPGRSRGII